MLSAGLYLVALGVIGVVGGNYSHLLYSADERGSQPQLEDEDGPGLGVGACSLALGLVLVICSLPTIHFA